MKNIHAQIDLQDVTRGHFVKNGFVRGEIRFGVQIKRQGLRRRMENFPWLLSGALGRTVDFTGIGQMRWISSNWTDLKMVDMAVGGGLEPECV